MTIESAIYIPWLPAVAAVLCGLCCTHRRLRRWAAPICIAAIAGGFLISVSVAGHVGAEAQTVKAFNWLSVGQVFTADFGYYLDPLTVVMLFVVTGIGSLVAIYAAGYMSGDRGYARFFAGVSLFIFAMTTLVMADNLVLLYLGWEGVGLCSYLLIGYYYQKPSAVAAAKKAFIVNRIGDLGFALGIFLTFMRYDSVAYSEIFARAASGATSSATSGGGYFVDKLIPFLLMLGAFGKSAQLPLYVWLPDAMEGPTPVSALIHAATMVTAGVYMIARLLPLFVLSPYALPTVAVVGGLTALFAATIALCQYDIKRIYAYSTISQLGYMFLGVGMLSTVGGVFHLFTHAFFKALLFLTAGSVMHALSGQLDLRKMSGLRKPMPVTCWLMFAGCLALAGFPFTAGFYSKDMILAATIEHGLGAHNNLFIALGVVGLFTAGLTAFYTFRLWFRVFMGPTKYEMGHEHHGDAHGEAPGGATHGVEAESPDKTPITIEHEHEAHEVGWLMNGPLLVLAAGALLAGVLGEGWIEQMVGHSSAAAPAAAPAAAAGGGAVLAAEAVGQAHAGENLHTIMMLVSSAIAVIGIALAAWYHWLNRAAADRVAAQFSGLVRLLANKYYVDELYDALIVRPLRTVAGLCYLVDRLVIDGLVSLVGFLPRVLGMSFRPAQQGVLQGYGLGMAAGAAAMIVLVWMLTH